MSKEELKPCPFCGGTAILVDCGEDSWWNDDPDGRFFVHCLKCGIEQDNLSATKQIAIERWNRRVKEDGV